MIPVSAGIYQTSKLLNIMESLRTKENINTIINNYLERNRLLEATAPWIVKESPLGGFGVFVTRDICRGELIFRDHPVLLGTRCLEESPRMCVSCFCKTNVKPCTKECGLLVCSEACEENQTHKIDCKLIKRFQNNNNQISLSTYTENLMKSLTPLKSLTLDSDDKKVIVHLKAHRGSRHGYEVQLLMQNLNFNFNKDEEEFLRFVCSVLDANAFEVLLGHEKEKASLRGLYPLGSLANHRCYPNAYYVFDDQQRMVVRAGVDMKKGTEIFHSYSRIIWGTATRSFHLRKTKHFVCKCKRCLDPTEFGTYMSSIYCEKCLGKVIPLNPINKSSWQCEDCRQIVTVQDVAKVLSLIGSVLKGFEDNEFKFMYKFLTEKLPLLVPKYNQVAVEIKYKIVWILGHKPGYLWSELTLELLNIKISFCHDILVLLEKLNIGHCKIRGLLLYELYLCQKEIKKRDGTENSYSKDVETLLEEAADILNYDVTAPQILKKYSLLYFKK